MEIKVKTANGTKGGFERLASFLEQSGLELGRNLSPVLNKTAGKVKSSTTEPKGIKQALGQIYAPRTIKAKEIGELIKVNRAGKDYLKAKVNLSSSRRPYISQFKPSFTKKNGVTYKMIRKDGRKRIPDAFNVNGFVGKRVTKKRKPLRWPKGVSPAVLFLGSSKLYDSMPENISKYLNQFVNERINFLLLKIAKNKGVAK